MESWPHAQRSRYRMHRQHEKDQLYERQERCRTQTADAKARPGRLHAGLLEGQTDSTQSQHPQPRQPSSHIIVIKHHALCLVSASCVRLSFAVTLQGELETDSVGPMVVDALESGREDGPSCARSCTTCQLGAGAGPTAYGGT